jgi:hypothetical protein
MSQKPSDADDLTLTDFITGKKIPNIGAEANRQAFEKVLVTAKGYRPEDILVDVPLEMTVAGEFYASRVDLVVHANGVPVMAVKCAAGSLGSREREILAAARLMDQGPIPLCVVTDGRTAVILDTVSGKRRGEGLDAVWSREEAAAGIHRLDTTPLPEERIEREKLIFRSYDSMNINRS